VRQILLLELTKQVRAHRRAPPRILAHPSAQAGSGKSATVATTHDMSLIKTIFRQK